MGRSLRKSAVVSLAGTDESIDFIISDLIIEKWQRTINLLAKSLGSNSARISRFSTEYLETFITSDNPENPDLRGNRYDSKLNWYCKKVYVDKRPLRINNSADDFTDLGYESADSTQYDVKSYLGYPLELPNGKVLGTICVEDRVEKKYGEREEKILLEFKQIVEDDIRHLLELFGRYVSTLGNTEIIEDINNNISISFEKFNLSVNELLKEHKDLADLTISQASQIQKLREIITQSIHLNSHKLRGPLARILGLIRILNIDFKNSEEILSYLTKSAEELDLIIHEMQDTLQSEEQIHE